MHTQRDKDIFGKAIMDFYQGKNAVIKTYSSLGGWDEIPVAYLFRSYEEMPGIEKRALKMATGKVLDLGCGAGCHSKYLVSKGLWVKPVDISGAAIEVCKRRGLINAEAIDLWHLKNVQFDTILVLMNGAGLCGTMDKIPEFLTQLKSLLTPQGQILMDSTDVIYMYEDEDGISDLSEVRGYYGEVQFQAKYKEENSGPYPWLYIDFYSLQEQASRVNLNCELVMEGSHYDFLARLSHKNS